MRRPPEFKEGWLVIEEIQENEEKKTTVRVFASFDMAWSQRGNGYTYDSLNGFCCLIGVQSGKIIAYKSFNRMCKQCQIIAATGNYVEHDCRLNYSGCAKGMEAEGAVALVTNSQSLKDANVQIGGFTADNDSGSKKAVQEATDYPVLIQSDISHTKKNFKNMLWEIGKDKSKDPDSELSKDMIVQFVRSFSSAVHQNKGQLEDMKSSILSIISHAKGDHSHCKDWCGVVSKKSNYESTIALENDILIDEVEKLIEKVANNAECYLTAGSSQANESVNNTMASKNPKRLCLSQSASTDYRFAATVAQKNLGESYVEEILKKLGIDAAAFLSDFFLKNQKIAIKRYAKAREPAEKCKRLERARARNQLKFRTEKMSENIYEQSSSFFENVKPTVCLRELEKFTPFSTHDFVIIFYDLETAGLNLRDEILQIAMAGDNWTFNSYITPKKAISSTATAINKLSSSGRYLFKKGVQVFTLSKVNAFNKMFDFLNKFGKKCLLVAHNDPFDAPRLVQFVERWGQSDKFKEIIYGFSDSLVIFKKKLKDFKSHKLEFLAESFLPKPCTDAHDAAVDVGMLRELIAEKQLISIDELIEVRRSYDDIIEILSKQQTAKKNMSKLTALRGVIKPAMVKRLAENGISLELIQQVYADAMPDCKEKEVIKLLKGEKEGKATIIKTKKILDHIMNFLRLNNFKFDKNKQNEL